MLNGGAGADKLDGGAGNDFYVVDAAGDTIVDSAGSDVAMALVNYTLADTIEELRLLGTANLAGTGNAFANVLRGNAGANTLTGLDGDDLLDGGAGKDTLVGGNGNDRYVVDQSDDTIVELSGIDRVAASCNYKLGAGVEYLVLSGLAATTGVGNALDNIVNGNGADNVLYGLEGRDTLNGGAGSDTISSGGGRDVLFGGTGNDFLLFDTALSSTTNVDRIRDFSGADDTIVLSKGIFTGISHIGALFSSEFTTGSTARDADDRIVYNAATGGLIYDSNGNQAGGATFIAVLSAGLTLGAADFVIA